MTGWLAGWLAGWWAGCPYGRASASIRLDRLLPRPFSPSVSQSVALLTGTRFRSPTTNFCFHRPAGSGSLCRLLGLTRRVLPQHAVHRSVAHTLFPSSPCLVPRSMLFWGTYLVIEPRACFIHLPHSLVVSRAYTGLVPEDVRWNAAGAPVHGVRHQAAGRGL